LGYFSFGHYWESVYWMKELPYILPFSVFPLDNLSKIPKNLLVQIHTVLPLNQKRRKMSITTRKNKSKPLITVIIFTFWLCFARSIANYKLLFISLVSFSHGTIPNWIKRNLSKVKSADSSTKDTVPIRILLKALSARIINCPYLSWLYSENAALWDVNKGFPLRHITNCVFSNLKFVILRFK